MNIELVHVALIIGAAALICAIVLFVLYRRVSKRIENLRRIYVQAVRSGETPPDDELIAQWQQQYEALPENTPKWHAYRNRLIEVGAIDGG